MTNVTISRELLERIDESAICDGTDATISDDLFTQLVGALDAPLQPEEDAHKHEAQPEVAQNTGSRSMTNKLSSQGCTGCTGVEGVAAPCETPDAVDIFAWATFDGEGSYDLRLYEDNEGYLDDFRDANPLLHPDWVFPLCRLSDAQRAIAELRGLVPELPPRPPEGDGMPRYGLRWNGPRQPVSVPMADGYWTPWHLAEAECEHLKDCQENAMLHMTGLVSERDTLRQQLAELRAQLLAIASAEPRRHTIEWAKAMAATGNNEAYAKWREAFDQRDRLAGLLRHASSVLGSQGWDALTHEIDAALAKLEGKA